MTTYRRIFVLSDGASWGSTWAKGGGLVSVRRSKWWEHGDKVWMLMLGKRNRARLCAGCDPKHLQRWATRKLIGEVCAQQVRVNTTEVLHPLAI
jgi:hypothetical protein